MEYMEVFGNNFSDQPPPSLSNFCSYQLNERSSSSSGSEWVCEMREPNKKSRIWLGTHQTAEMAARALRGQSACLNFADSAWRLHIPTSGVIKDIQKAAAEAAYTFRPVDAEGVVSSDDVKEVGSTSTQLPENVFFMDEEEIFSMPSLLADMAEGLMLPPPQFVDDKDVDVVESNADMFLWDYSV